MEKKSQIIGSMTKVFMFLLVITFSSCESNSLDDLLEEDPITENDPDADDQSDDDDNDDTATLVTYQNTAKAILDNACVQCHNQSNANGGVRLHNYENAAAVAESGRMIARMTSVSSPMPPSGNLPDPIVRDIMDWINDGLLEN